MNSDQPYLHRIKVKVIKEYNSDYGDERICKCGHVYYRHFDSWEDMQACGCKYCSCYTFEEVTPEHCFGVIDDDNMILFKFNTKDKAIDKLYELIGSLMGTDDTGKYGVQECKWEDEYVEPIVEKEYDENEDDYWN